MATEHRKKKVKYHSDKTTNQLDIPELLVMAETGKGCAAVAKMSTLPSAYVHEKPISLLVGPEKFQFYVQKGFLAAKSPFFHTLFKDCWDGEKEEVELSGISSEDFRVVFDWLHTGKLPAQVTQYSLSDLRYWEHTLGMHKAADAMMIGGLQNSLILNEAARLMYNDFTWNLRRLRQLHDYDLCHTKYYRFVLKSVTINVMEYMATNPEQWNEEMKSVEDIPFVLADMLRSVRDWARDSWNEFPDGDLSEFLVDMADE